MIRGTRNWLRRHQSKFAIGFGVIGAGYVATQYVLSKLAEARESMSSDHIARENLRRRFAQNQEDCTFTVLALLPTAAEGISSAVPVENIHHELQQRRAERLARSAGSTDITSSEISSGTPSVTDEDTRSLNSGSYIRASQMAESKEGEAPLSPENRRSKVQLWNDLKMNSIVRSFTLVYTLSLLTLLTRIQLNLLGRRNYVSSVVALAGPAPADSTISLEDNDVNNGEQMFGDDYETNRRYLTFSWWLLHRGWRQVKERVEDAVKTVFGPLNPGDDVTMERISQLTVEVRKLVEGSTDVERESNKWLSYLLPPPSDEAFVLQESGVDVPPASSDADDDASKSLRSLLDETADLIDSPLFNSLVTRLLDAGFSLLIDSKVAQEFIPKASSSGAVAPLPETVTSKKLAVVCAALKRQARPIGSGNVPNEYLQTMEEVAELEAFAAVIYSSHFDVEKAKLEQQKKTPNDSSPTEASGSSSRGDEWQDAGISSGFEQAWGKAKQAVSGDR